MTPTEVAICLGLLETAYGKKFYGDSDKQTVIKLWATIFRDDDALDVNKAVIDCINTEKFAPTIADIRLRMSRAKMAGQMTELEAFQRIAQAVNKSYSYDDAVIQFSELPTILKKLVGNPHQLRDWYLVEPAQFQTVVASLIRSSYRELANREASYYAPPKQLQDAESWRLPEAQSYELPAPKRQKSLDEILDDMDKSAKEYRQRYGMTAPGNEEKVEKFKEEVNP